MYEYLVPKKIELLVFKVKHTYKAFNRKIEKGVRKNLECCLFWRVNSVLPVFLP